VLANRIKRVLSSIIDNSQTTFFKGREFLNVILVAIKVVEDIRREKKSRVIIKVVLKRPTIQLDESLYDEKIKIQ